MTLGRALQGLAETEQLRHSEAAKADVDHSALCLDSLLGCLVGELSCMLTGMGKLNQFTASVWACCSLALAQGCDCLDTLRKLGW